MEKKTEEFFLLSIGSHSFLLLDKWKNKDVVYLDVVTECT